MLDFVTNRTQINVNTLRSIQAKSWQSMNSEEKRIWENEASKAAYNYTDLNRVETAVMTISNYLGLNLSTRTNWTVNDIPVSSEMNRYINNVWAIIDATKIDEVYTFGVPTTMNNLTYLGANAIEKALWLIYAATRPIDYVYIHYLLGEHVVATNNTDTVELGEYYITQLMVNNSDWKLGDVTVTLANTDITTNVYNPETGVIHIPSVTDDVIIRANSVLISSLGELGSGTLGEMILG